MKTTNEIKTWLKWLATNQPLPERKGIPFKIAEFRKQYPVVVADYRKEHGI